MRDALFQDQRNEFIFQDLIPFVGGLFSVLGQKEFSWVIWMLLNENFKAKGMEINW